MIGVDDLFSATQNASSQAMCLLARGVPLTLLIDLVLGPDSEQLLVDERLSQLTQFNG